MKKITLSVLSLLLIAAFNSVHASSIGDELSSKIDLIVSQDGSGDFTTVQEAINAVADSNSEQTIIFIRKGIYYEKVLVPYKKMNITLVGEDVDSTVITYDDDPEKVDGNTWGTYTMRVDAPNFTAINLTFENSAGDNGQALAFSSFGDKHLFYHCRFLGWQDTYFINFRCRNYMKDCFIEGSVDYIYGYGIGVYDSCQVHTIREGQSGVITAAATSRYNRFGLTFRDSRLTAVPGAPSFTLGRPWQGKPHVVFMNTYEPTNVNNAAWSNMNSGRDPLFAEYKCYGAGYRPGSRSTHPDYTGIQLSDEAAIKYQSIDTIFAAASFADEDEKELEEAEMYQPFYDANLRDLILEVMIGSRDTFPDIPKDDWMPRIDTNSFVKAVQSKFKHFMDSSNMDAPVIDSVYADGVIYDDFDPETINYLIESPEGQTTPIEFEIFLQNGHSEIKYPNALPDFTYLYVSSYDYTIKTKYTIFNSTDSAFWDADLSFLGFNRTDTIEIVPGVYTYDVVLEPEVSSVSSIQFNKSYKRSTVSASLPDVIPGKAELTVTSMSKTVEKVYTVNFTQKTAINNAETDLDEVIMYSPVEETATMNFSNPIDGVATIQLYDITGKVISIGSLETTYSEKNYHLNLSSISKGIYFYQVNYNKQQFGGKLIKR